jgi:hypothetical protein
MPALKDEMVFLADGMVPVDPALGLRERAQAFIRSRQWTTSSIHYGDQPEPELSQRRPSWSITFGLGLDHVPKTTGDWFADVLAIIEFLQPFAREERCEFILEFRLSSRPWYSETLDYITDAPGATVDIAHVRAMLQRLMRGKPSWWERLVARYKRPGHAGLSD